MKIFFLICSLVFSFNVLAMGNHDHADDMDSPVFSNKELVEKADCKNKVEIEVYGLVCDFCARAVEKVFSKKEEVQAIDVDLDEGEVVIAFNEGQNLDDEILAKMIEDSGYNLVEIERGCDD